MSVVESENLESLEELTEVEELANVIFTEDTTIPELIEALRRYVAVNGPNLQPLADTITSFSRECAEINCDFTFGWISEEVNSNPNSKSISTLSPLGHEMKDFYELNSEVNGNKFLNDICLPTQVFTELLRNTALDGNNIEFEKPFDSKIIVQLYNDYREAIIDSYSSSTVDAIIGFYATPVNLIAAGASNDAISAYFEAAEVENEAKRQAEFEATMSHYSESEKAAYDEFYATSTPTPKP